MKPSSEYYAVIFSSQVTGEDAEGYSEMSAQMEALASEQTGFLGIESARGQSGFGITVSYWKDEESIVKWKRNAEHIVAQKWGREKWYRNYAVRICKVSRAYQHPSG